MVGYTLVPPHHACDDDYSFHKPASEFDIQSTYTDISSLYKERIDSLFRHNTIDKKKSKNTFNKSHENIYSEISPKPVVTVTTNGSEVLGGSNYNFSETRNAVQAQIERLFANVGRESVNSSVPSPAPTKKVDTPAHSPVQPIYCKAYEVDYLGSVTVSERGTSLETLQLPLRRLYLDHKSAKCPDCDTKSTLEILDDGLRILSSCCRGDGNVKELFNPFQTIAVWAAVKLVLARQQTNGPFADLKSAFVPLIADPESKEKTLLFKPMSLNEARVMIRGPHPPMFMCVMRQTGISKHLECHAFICKCPEDAILIAANLYQALMENLDTPNEDEHNYSSIPPFISTDSNIVDDRGVFSDSEITPIRPPRKKKLQKRHNHCAVMNRSISMDKMPFCGFHHPHSPNILMTSFRNSSLEMSTSFNEESEGMKRSTSARQLSELEKKSCQSWNGEAQHGDMYSKVVLPRSQSFMTVPTDPQQGMQHRKCSSTFDLHDFLDDVEIENFFNTDDILRQVIKAEGMSFNDLKPMHKELLLKVALTLTKDEMFRKSKHIMREQLRKQKSSSLMSLLDFDHDNGAFSNAVRATKRSITKLNTKQSIRNGGTLQREKHRSRMHHGINRVGSITTLPRKINVPLVEPDSLSYNTQDDGSETYSLFEVVPPQSSTKSTKTEKATSPVQIPVPSPLPVNNVAALRQKMTLDPDQPPSLTSFESVCTECDGEHCTEKCYCSLPRKNHPDHQNQCSDENCASSEKCYCSLQRVKPDGLRVYTIDLGSNTSLSGASDSDNSTIVEEEEQPQHGSTDKPFLDTRADSPLTAWKRNMTALSQQLVAAKIVNAKQEDDQQLPQQYASLQRKLSTLESCRKRPHSQTTTRCNNGIPQFLPKVNISRSNTFRKGEAGAGADQHGHIVLQSESGPTRCVPADPNNVISMKKSAEIAAIFTGIPLQQTTDVFNESEQQTDEDGVQKSTFYSGSDMELSLGYLP